MSVPRATLKIHPCVNILYNYYFSLNLTRQLICPHKVENVSLPFEHTVIQSQLPEFNTTDEELNEQFHIQVKKEGRR